MLHGLRRVLARGGIRVLLLVRPTPSIGNILRMLFAWMHSEPADSLGSWQHSDVIGEACHVGQWRRAPFRPWHSLQRYDDCPQHVGGTGRNGSTVLLIFPMSF
jgi:hypothetical protein